MAGPLEGTRVVELTEGISGPYCSMELGDAGADVIKVERLRGDTTRGWPPFVGDEGAVFLGLNRNKRSIALDWSTAAGKEVLARLTRRSDVLLEDLGVEQMREIGLGYAAAARSHPELVYLSISTYGEHGPFAGRPGSELVGQAMSEMTASLGRIGEPPVRLGTDAASTYAGYYGFIAVLTALFQRNRTRRGQRVWTSLVGSALFMRSTLWTAHSDPDEWWGFHLDSYVKPPDYAFTATDGQFTFSFMRGFTQERWEGFLRDLGLEQMKDHPQWGNMGRDVMGQGRYSHLHRDTWNEAFKSRSIDEISAIVERHGGNVYRLHNYEMVFDHPQTQTLNMVEEIDHPTAGRIKMVGIPWKLHDTPGSVRLAPPLLGQHTDEILRELDFTAGEIEAFRREGAVR